jgi:drug/metabolite transporter (DMT)-like permease
MMAVAVRLAATHMDPVQVAWVRCVGSVLMLLLATRGRGLRPRRENWLAVALRGVLGASSLTLYYVAVAWAGAGLATLLHCTYPVWTVLWVAARAGRRVGAGVVVALALNFAGAMVAIGPDVAIGSNVRLGGIIALLAGVLAGGAVATASELRQSESTTLVTTWFMGTGAVMLLPSLAFGVPPLTAPLAGALFAVIVTSVIGQLLLHHGLGTVSATAGALATATSTVTAALAEAAVYNTSIPPRMLLAGVMMLGAVWLVGRR